MIYDRENTRRKFSEEQYLSPETENAMYEEYEQFLREMLHVDVTEFNQKMHGIKTPDELTDEEESKKRKKLIGAVIGVIFFSAMVLTLMFKQLVIFGYLGCFIFAFAGISLIITGKAEVVESASFVHKNRIIGFGITLGSVLLALMILFRGHFSSAVFFILLFVIVFGIAGVTLMIVMILNALSDKLIYTQEVSATCAGYVRYVDREDRFSYIYTSPLFKYSYEGIQYESVYDVFLVKKDSDIPLGQTVTIRIDPKNPSGVLSPITKHKGGLAMAIVMGIAFTAVAVGLAWFVGTGRADDMTVETQWDPLVNRINGETERNVAELTDEMVQENIASKLQPGEEWYYEIATVGSKEVTEKGEVISFTDPTFNTILYTERDAPEPGTQLLVFYVINEEVLEYGIRYKSELCTAYPDQYEYVGTHGAYVPEVSAENSTDN